MLLLTRKPGEEIVFNNNTRLLIVSTNGGFVQVGIDRPNDPGRINTLRGDHIDLDESPDDFVNLFPDQPDSAESTTELVRGDALLLN